MTLERANPIAIEVLGDYAQRTESQIQNLIERVRTTDNDNAGWLRRQLGFIKARFGKRRQKRVPWVGASNISVPLTDGIIRRWRPGITSLILDANPVAFFVARDTTDFDPARVTEPFFTWLFVDHMQTPREVARLVDLVASRGHAYSREGWKYETQRQARIVDVDAVFPEGLQTYLETQSQNLQAQVALGQVPQDQAQIDPVVIVAKRISDEYGLSIQNPEERDQLLGVSQALLQGAQRLKIVYESIKHDRPEWTAIDPVNIITDRCGDPETADFIAVVHEFDAEQLKRLAHDGRLRMDKVNELIARADNQSQGSAGGGGGTARRQIRDFQDTRAGTQSIRNAQSKTHKITVWEIFCHMDVNGDGLNERCVVWYAPEAEVTLQAEEFVVPIDTWPLTVYQFEAHAESPTDSRGIPELLSDLHKLVNAFHNARVDATQLVLAPVYQRRVGSSDYAQTIQWRPGTFIPVDAVGDIAPLQSDLNILIGLLQEEQNEQRIAESFIGTFDATINQLNQPTERRTAAEVNAITQLAQNVFGLDARMFQISMARSFRKIWQLWMEFGPEEVFFRVTGEQQPRQALKKEIAHQYDITPAGTPSSTNRAFLMASMERVLQIIINDQSGRFDVGALLEAYFKLIDQNLAKTVIRSPEQTEAARAVQQASQLVTGKPMQI